MIGIIKESLPLALMLLVMGWLYVFVVPIPTDLDTTKVSLCLTWALIVLAVEAFACFMTWLATTYGAFCEALDMWLKSLEVREL